MPADDQLPPRRWQQRWELGSRLRELRTSKKLSQVQLQELSGVDNKTISRIENGRTNTGIDELGRLADALDVPVWRLFRDG